MILALTVIALLQNAAAPEGITRTVVQTTATMEATRFEYAPGAVEPPGNHGYDVVIVPVDEGMTVELEGEAVTWTPGVPILISRGAPHHLANRSGHPVRYVSVRTIGDNLAGTDEVIRASRATIVRSVFGKYIRATVWRYEAGAHVEWPSTVDALIVHATPPGGVIVKPQSADTVAEGEVVRISRMVSR